MLAPRGSSKLAPYFAIFLGLAAVLFFWVLRYWIVLESDISVYKATFTSSVSFDIYYLKEFLFWFAGWFFEIISGSEFALFLFDLVFLSCVFAFYFKYPNLGPGWVIIVLFSFPSVIGFSNILRQHLATALFATGIFVGPRILVAFSIFTHNLTLFFGTIYFNYFGNIIKYFVMLSSSALLLAYIIFFDDRSGGQTGDDSRFFLSAICFALALGLLFIHGLKITRPGLLFTFLSFSLAVTLVQNEIFYERLMIFLCGFLCFVYAVSCSRLKSSFNVRFVKVWLYIFCVTPVYFSKNTNRLIHSLSELLQSF